MPHDRLVTIAQRLLDLTKAGRLRWQPMARPEGEEGEWQSSEFATRLPKGTVVVDSADAQGRYPYGMKVLDTAGAEVARLETGQDAERFLGDGEADPWEVTIHDLYAEARRSAVNPEVVLDAVIEALDQWASPKP
jgi:hypothetical protein